MEGYSQGTRVGAMLAAIEFIKAHADDKTRTKDSDRWLAELGLTKDDVKLVDGELDYTDKKIQNAIFRWVDGAILRPNAAVRPAWASDPHYALLFHMKQFTYASHKIFLERIANEAKNGNLNPAMAMVMTYVPAMIAADFLRGIVSNGGKEPWWKRKWGFSDYLMSGVERAGLFGIPQLGLDVVKYGPAELTGPFGEQIARSAGTFAKTYKHDMKLDEIAATKQTDKAKARAQGYDWKTEGGKRVIRDALPAGRIMKDHVYDPIVKEIEKLSEAA